MAALLGPQLVTYLSALQRSRGVPKTEAYNLTFYVMAGVLMVGLLCNLLVSPVDPEHYASDVGTAAPFKP